LVLAAAIVFAQELPDHRVHIPDGERPPILERVSRVDGLVAVTLGAAGSRAAVATFDPQAKRSTVQLFSDGEPEPRVLGMTGRVRDVQFAFDGETVYALLAKETKKRVADTQLMSIDFARAKSRSVMRVPPTAAALDLWHDQGSLLIASLDAIRTVSIPELRSGPLFAVPGQNLAVISIGRTSRLLIGQSDSLFEVDLKDPPGETSLPIRDRVATTQPVAALAAASDGAHALARMADGTLALIRFAPLRVREVGRADAIAELEPDPAVTTPPAASTQTSREYSQAADPAPGTPASAAPPAVAGTAALAEATQAPSPAAPPAEPQAEAPAESVEQVAPPEAPPTESPSIDDAATGFTVTGQLVGPAADRVLAVVFLGPNNLLNEAARVRPWSDGKWEIHLTEPGRYRVQLDGGGDQVLVSDPSFRLIELGVEDPPTALNFKVLRVL